MNLSRIYAIFIRQLYLIKSNPVRLAHLFLWIIIDIVQWGFISKYLGSLGRATFSFITVILGAIILWSFMSRVQQGVMTAFLEDIWSRNFLNYFASPLKVGEYLSGLVLTSVMAGLSGFLAVAAIAGLAFSYNIFKIGLMLLPFMLILLIFGIALGLFTSALIFRFGPAAEWLGWPIPFILSIISGVYYPIATLPPALVFLAKLTPLSYVFESVRGLISAPAFSVDLGLNLLIGAGLTLFYLLAMYKFFIDVYRRNLRTGAIARFDAEGA